MPKTPFENQKIALLQWPYGYSSLDSNKNKHYGAT
jgi:hypothetical protein